MFAIVTAVLFIDPSYLIMYYSVKVVGFLGSVFCLFVLWNGYNATHCDAVSAILYCTMSVSTYVPFACMLGIRHRN